MSDARSRRRGSVLAVSLAALLTPPALATSAAADENTLHRFEEVAEATWSVPHQCANNVTRQARLEVETLREFESPDTDDARPTALVQYVVVCPSPEGTFRWSGTITAAITSTPDLKSLDAQGTGVVRDIFGVPHDVSFDVSWTGAGPLQTTTQPIQRSLVGTSIEKERAATATGSVTFDGDELVNGQANDSLRLPFIRTTDERYAQPPN